MALMGLKLTSVTPMVNWVGGGGGSVGVAGTVALAVVALLAVGDGLLSLETGAVLSVVVAGIGLGDASFVFAGSTV